MDVDECSTGQVVCSVENAVCVNILGSAFCSCETGYANVSGVCRDINECVADVCDQTCVNTDGSFLCTCKSGFILEDKCRDIDECNGNHGCNQMCQNTVGSYRCLCEDGFKLNLDDRQTCIAENECSDAEKNNCTENSYCYVSEGKANCKCFKGYQNVDGICADIDECLSNPCSQNCSNTEGLFECSCFEGYSLLSDGVTCQECSSWTYGHNCSSSCLCDQHNSQDCNHVTGACKCKKGWTGIQCNEDVNECKNESICSKNSSCENRNGSFACMCEIGFFKSGDGECYECDERHFGYNCFNECTCSFENTDDCQHMTGQCICNQGWTGNNCTDDLNECDNLQDICEQRPNSTCKNNIGSYICECNNGYQQINGTCGVCEKWHYGIQCEEKCMCVQENTDTCNHVTGNCSCKIGWKGMSCSIDIDECTEKASVCLLKPNSTCQNLDGSYSCDCDDGFIKQGDICTECLDNTYGERCSHKCDCNGTNAENENQSCDNMTGECICKSNWGGKTCDEDVNECERNKTLCKDEGNKTCVNTEGWFECDCIRGFTQQNETGDCIEDTGQTTQRPADGIVIDITVSFNFDLPNDTNLNSSKTYENLRKKCVESGFLGRFVSETVQIIVNDIRLGSVEVDYIILYGTKDSIVATALTEAVLDLQHGSYLIFDGENVSASSDTYKDLEPCALYKETIGGCKDGFTCEVEDGVPTCKLQEEGSYVNWSLVIGLSGAGMFLLIITALLLVVAWRYFERKGKTPDLNPRRFQETQHYRDDGDYRTGKWQEDVLDFMATRYHPWKFNSSRTWAPQGNVSAVEETHNISRGRKMKKLRGERE